MYHVTFSPFLFIPFIISALACIPVSTQCTLCPLSGYCAYYENKFKTARLLRVVREGRRGVGSIYLLSNNYNENNLKYRSVCSVFHYLPII